MEKVKSIINTALLFMLILLPILPFAQPLGNGYDSGDGDPDNVPTDTPFDTWLIVLVAVGVGYGIKKVLANNLKKKKANAFIKSEKIVKTE